LAVLLALLALAARAAMFAWRAAVSSDMALAEEVPGRGDRNGFAFVVFSRAAVDHGHLPPLVIAQKGY
jgi:hypothetical protein